MHVWKCRLRHLGIRCFILFNLLIFNITIIVIFNIILFFSHDLILNTELCVSDILRPKVIASEPQGMYLGISNR